MTNEEPAAMKLNSGLFVLLGHTGEKEIHESSALCGHVPAHVQNGRSLLHCRVHIMPLHLVYPNIGNIYGINGFKAQDLNPKLLLHS